MGARGIKGDAHNIANEYLRHFDFNSTLYFTQLVILDEVVKEQRPEMANCKVVVFYHKNETSNIFDN